METNQLLPQENKICNGFLFVGSLIYLIPILMEKSLVKLTAKSLKENPAMVASVVDFYEKYISETIKSGTLENVRIPLFGIFRVNKKSIHYLTQYKPTL